ncbi:MAG: helix-turn-helix domain-containing protein [Cyclobacteriaceae bacterium]
MTRVSELNKAKRCSGDFQLALTDTLNVVSGKWKLPILGALAFGKKRFREMEREIPQINPRMLSKELKDLEANGIITRTVYNTTPVSVEYELTASGRSFRRVLDAMIEWGLEHRKNTIGKKISKTPQACV